MKDQSTPLRIIEVDTHSGVASLPYHLLELADPSREMIDSYVYDGRCFVLTLEGKSVGVLVLFALDSTCLEIKNIAIDPRHQGKGLGSALLRHAESVASGAGYQRLRIGTGNSSLDQLGFYQRFGFEMDHVIANFFTEHYPEEIVENGIVCKHLIVLEKRLLV